MRPAASSRTGLIQRCQRLIADLFAVGEPLARYFTRRVASLPAPTGQLTS